MSYFDPNRDKFPLIHVLLVVVFLWFVLGFCLPSMLEDPAQEGQFGDMFGGVNALFSGLSIVGIVYAIILQHESLVEQRNSIDYQKNDIYNQKKELKETRREFQITRITTIVYNQLEKIQKELNNLLIKSIAQNEPDFHNRYAIKKLNLDFEPLFERLKNGGKPDDSISTNIYIISDNSESLYNFYETILLSYKLIINTVENDDLEIKDKKEVLSIFTENLGKEIRDNIEMTNRILEHYMGSLSLNSSRNTKNQKLLLLKELIQTIVELQGRLKNIYSNPPLKKNKLPKLNM
jgi:hypothetical protein